MGTSLSLGHLAAYLGQVQTTNLLTSTGPQSQVYVRDIEGVLDPGVGLRDCLCRLALSFFGVCDTKHEGTSLQITEQG